MRRKTNVIDQSDMEIEICMEIVLEGCREQWVMDRIYRCGRKVLPKSSGGGPGRGWLEKLVFINRNGTKACRGWGSVRGLAKEKAYAVCHRVVSKVESTELIG